MRDVTEVLRMKEEEIARVKKEVEALKLVATLLGEEQNPEHGADYRQLLQMP
jgi:hypothetical protein